MKNIVNHFLNCLLIFASMWSSLAMESSTTPVNVSIGVVLDLDSWLGKMGLNCIQMALTDFYASHPSYNTRISLSVRNFSGHFITSAAIAAQHLVEKSEVHAIIGPTTSKETYFVIDVGDKAEVPILTFAAASPYFSSIQNPYFFRVAQVATTQARAIRDLVKAFEWPEVVLILEDSHYGLSPISCLTGALQEANIRVPYLSVISSSATNDQIKKELHKLKTNQTRVFVVHMKMDLGSQLFAIAEQSGMMIEGYAWIMTDSLTCLLNLMNSSTIGNMQGALGVRTYIPRTTELFKDFEVRWRERTRTETADPLIVEGGLTNYGLWAYDAATALAMAVEKVETKTWDFPKTNITGNKMRNIGKAFAGVSRKGEKLREALSNTTFRGISGDFHFINGQLQASTFEIINVIGIGEKRVGFWAAKSGLRRNLMERTIKEMTSFPSESSLRQIVWPGDSASTPKGVGFKELKIGVPKSGFRKFVNVRRDPLTNETKFSGCCIEIFKAVVESLPYHLPFQFVPVSLGDGGYDALITQVHNEKIDGAVGDITIKANRSLYVDFTLPYSENGAAFIVPTKDKNKSNTWIFLRPLTWKLWLTIGCFFVYIGFVVWALEHRINEDFRGPPSNQIGTSFWFSFLTLVFAQRDRVVSNTARFVIIIWVFVVLILTQSYTASLTSFLTVQQLRPTFTSVDELLKNGARVGYQKDSFTVGILRHLGFKKSQLRGYTSLEMCDELLTLGTRNGGIDAAFDEMPYIKALQSTFCFKYTIIQPRYPSNGFAFAFNKYQTHITPDFSRAILNMTQQNTQRLEDIRQMWFFNSSLCEETPTEDSTYRLDLDNFWGLFLIAGITSSLSLIINIAIFLYQHKRDLMQFDPNDSIKTRLRALLRIFDQKDPRKSGKKTKQDSYRAPDIGFTRLPSPAFHPPAGSLNRSRSSLF